ncbi:MAG TPA: SLC13 family permease, partial [Dehalococcoidia bacterium]|nr:SLC13 family permease [Dehalococcoidia bacterium]
MSADAWTVTLILLGTIAAFASGRIRPEAIAMAAVLALGLTGVASPAQAFAGFSDPTVVTIAALFVLSTALERTGVAGRAGRGLLALVGRRETALIAAIMAVGGVAGALMNVVASTAVLLPVVIAVCRETGISPSRLLMPLAIASRLGGAMTLIGKPTNLVVSS